MSAVITPKLNIKAARNPLVALVSSKTKNTGPIKKLNRAPKYIAVNILSKIKK